MGKAKPRKSYCRKKRKFYGNAWTKRNTEQKNENNELVQREEVDEPAPPPAEAASSPETEQNIEEGESLPSQAKLIPESILNESVDSLDDENDGPDGIRFIDVSNLINFVNQFSCPACHATNSTTASESRQGLSSSFSFTCDICGHSTELRTSKNISSKTKPHAEINKRAVFAMCSIGGHHQDLKRLCGSMDIPCNMSERTWNNHLRKIHEATKKCATMSMKRAGEDLRGDVAQDEVVNATVSCDGTWQRRGFSSKNGIGTVLSVAGKKSKVLDVEVLSNHCGMCMKKKKALSDGDYKKWYESHTHECNKNYTGSSGGMEPTSMETIFRRSEESHRLRYVGYLGDGDSKSFHRVSNANPPVYENVEIKKLECCGHVQKRMGKQLLEKTKSLKTVSFTQDGKTVKGIGGGGKGRLTAAKIKRLQGHYGGAIRKNAGNVPAMRKAIWATWKHRGGDHMDCGSWCPAKEGNLDEANKNSLADFVLKAIKPIYEKLSKDQLLEACAHGGNQNTNESYHHMIWERCPKQTFVGRMRLEIATYDGAIVYNEGESGRLVLKDELGFTSGQHWKRFSYLKDLQRIKNSKRLSSKDAKKARKDRRIEAADIEEQNQELEGNVYVSGGF